MMRYIQHTLNFAIEEASVITLGKFDGLHRGHETLMETMRSVSRDRNLATVVFTFDMPPRNRVQEQACQVLTTNEEKHIIFERSGVDYLIECPFTPEVMHMDPAEFVRWIVKALNVKVIVTGSDFRFGYKRGGDYLLLDKMQQEMGYELMVMDKLQDNGKDISSTYVRDEIMEGHIEKANELLGYPYFVRSVIVHGNRIGRTIGIPTINMVLPEDKLLPPYGVYATKVRINDVSYMAVTNVGRKPTIQGRNPVGVETYILHYDGDLYDEIITVEFYSFLRPEMKFASIAELQAQMQKDIEHSREYLERNQKF